MPNKSLGTDTQPKAAASRRMLRAGQRQHWASKGESRMRFRWCVLPIAIALFPGVSFAGKCDQVLAKDQLVECLGKEFSVADSALNKTYNILKTKLDREGKELLKNGQVAWLTYRDKDCELQALAVAGGQAYQPTFISCQTEKTNRRTQELKGAGW